MILVGQYDSPYVRRVAISLRVLGFSYEHDTRSVFADFDAMRAVNPLGRIPSLVLDEGEVLDRFGGDPRLARSDRRARSRSSAPWRHRAAPGAPPDRARDRRDRQDRRRRLRAHDPARRRCAGPNGSSAAAPRAQAPSPRSPPSPGHLRTNSTKPQITTACMIRYVRMADPDLLPPAAFPSLDALSARCEALAAFDATWPADYVLPTNP